MQEPNEGEVHPITTSEAFLLLQPLKGRYKNTRSETYQIFKKTLDYTETFSRIKDRSMVDELRSYLAELGLNEEEIATLGSLLPQTSDDGKICIPSISRLDDEVIDRAIEKIQQIF